VPMALVTIGCSHAFARQATRYAELGRQAASTLRPTVVLVHRTCEQSRRVEFVQQRLLRLKSEALGVAPGPEYYFDGAHWGEQARAATGSLNWRDYCQAMDRSAAAFAIGLTALRAHANAVGELARESQTYHPDFAALHGGAQALAQGIREQDSPWLKLVPPLTNPVKELSHLWLAEQNQASLERLLVLAEPTVRRLVTALQQYLDAIAGQLLTLSTRQATLVQSLEQNAGFGARAEAARGQRCRTSTPASPEGAELPQLCEWSRLQQRQLDAVVLLLLTEHAEVAAGAARADASRLTQFKEVLQAFESSSIELARAARSGDDAALARAAQDLHRLAEVLQNAEDE